ncbi:MAG: TetR/AcrR family transcriptional regulator [Acidimicrobiales bacterium]|nr:TetR/AcrR family transcriptional regulator [Acidimicrobiales bacterium]
MRSCDPRPSVGRPRSTEADQAIIDATLDLFAAHGYDGVTIEAVAENAGVARSTIYRRFPTKAELLMAALEATTPAEGLMPDTGSLEDDLFQLAVNLRQLLRSSRLGRVLPAALAARSIHPELAALHENFIRRRRKRSIEIVRRAIERAEIRQDTDPEILIDAVVGPLFFRKLLSGGRIDDRALRQFAKAAVDAHRIDR